MACIPVHSKNSKGNDHDDGTLAYEYDTGALFIFRGRWLPLMGETRSDEDVPYVKANIDQFIAFTRPLPSARYSVNAWIQNDNGTMGVRLVSKTAAGFVVNGIEAGKLGYQAMVKI